VSRVSACSFIVETDDLWQRRIERAHYYDAPRVERDGGKARFVCPGDPSIGVDLAGIPWIDDPACSGNPFVRVPQLEKEGIKAEILFPTLSWALLSLPEPLRSASFIAYNSWVWNIFTTAPKRLFAAAILPPANAAGELQRMAPMGVKAAIVPVEAIGAALDALWSAAASANIPLVMAKIGGATPFGDFARFTKESAELARQAAGAQEAVRFLTFGAAEAGAPDNVTYVDHGGSGQLWGRLGAPASGTASDDGKAAAFFNLPA
jgi:hypothetical protein